MSTTVGELNVKMNLELSRLDGQIALANAKMSRMSRGMHADIAKSAKGMNAAIGAIGAAGAVGAIVAAAAIVSRFAFSLVDLGSRITDLSSAANLTPETFQKISVSAMNAGVSMEEVSKSSEHLRSALQTAVENGASPLNVSLAKINLTAAGLKSLKPEDQWAVLGDKLRNASTKQAAMNVVSDLFGTKIGPKLRSTLIAISQGIDSIDTDGLIIKDEQLKKLDEGGDKFDRFVLRFKVGAVEVAEKWSNVFANLSDMRDSFVNSNFTLKKGSFADELFRDKRQDISRGETLLPGGNAKKSLTPAQIREDQMDAAASASRKAALAADPFLKMRESKAKKDKLEADMHLFFDDIDELTSKDPIKKKGQALSELGTNLAPTDSFARIGLMTGAVANPEMKTQTGLLKGIHSVLEKINSGVRDAEAGFAN